MALVMVGALYGRNPVGLPQAVSVRPPSADEWVLRVSAANAAVLQQAAKAALAASPES